MIGEILQSLDKQQADQAPKPKRSEKIEFSPKTYPLTFSEHYRTIYKPLHDGYIKMLEEGAKI